MKLRAKDLVYFQILFAVFLNLAVTNLKLPSMIAYFADGINILLLIWAHRRFISRILKTEIHRYIWPLYVMGGVLLVGILVNMTDPFYVIWGARNNFRFILFWLICIAIFDESDEQRLFGLLYKLFHINAVFAFFQYFVLGLEQDFVGGIFGTVSGGNGRLNIFMCIVLCYFSAQYICRQCSLRKMTYILITSILIAVFAELKFFYLEIILIIILTVFAAKPSFKVLGVVIAGIAAVFIGLQVLAVFDPGTYAIITNFDRLMAYAHMESGGYNISRMGAFLTINRLFFQGSPMLNLFGFGLGNCDTSNFPVFNSLFYRQYGRLHYTWFSHQQWFLETGYLGLGCFVLFFVMLIVYAIRKKQYMAQHRAMQIFAITFPVVLLANLVYNNSIRLEIAYLSFACLAMLPVIVRAEKHKLKGVTEH